MKLKSIRGVHEIEICKGGVHEIEICKGGVHEIEICKGESVKVIPFLSV